MRALRAAQNALMHPHPTQHTKAPCTHHNAALQGDYGPFMPNMPIQVPIWLAAMLHKRKKCRIQAPEWMNAETLQSAGEGLCVYGGGGAG